MVSVMRNLKVHVVKGYRWCRQWGAQLWRWVRQRRGPRQWAAQLWHDKRLKGAKRDDAPVNRLVHTGLAGLWLFISAAALLGAWQVSPDGEDRPEEECRPEGEVSPGGEVSPEEVLSDGTMLVILAGMMGLFAAVRRLVAVWGARVTPGQVRERDLWRGERILFAGGLLILAVALIAVYCFGVDRVEATTTFSVAAALLIIGPITAWARNDGVWPLLKAQIDRRAKQYAPDSQDE